MSGYKCSQLLNELKSYVPIYAHAFGETYRLCLYAYVCVCVRAIITEAISQ